MNATTFYKSTIPPEATPRPIGKYPNGRPKRIEYYIGKVLVGKRYYSYPGYPEVEVSYLNGKKHGWEYNWHSWRKMYIGTEEDEDADDEIAPCSIPADAVAKVDQTYRDGRPMWIHYFIGQDLVGQRFVSRSGEVRAEYAYPADDEWDNGANLLSATPYEHGIAHGTAYQWDSNGGLIGTYTMVNGTGTDLWWQESSDSEVVLTEAHQCLNNMWHGYEWWFRHQVPPELSIEKWWHEGKLHGIERHWNLKGRLSRGWPKYWIHNQQADKRKYIRAAANDPLLPPFRIEDNLPHREFPPEVARYLR